MCLVYFLVLGSCLLALGSCFLNLTLMLNLRGFENLKGLQIASQKISSIGPKPSLMISISLPVQSKIVEATFLP
jgi:hypothetical protein